MDNEKRKEYKNGWKAFVPLKNELIYTQFVFKKDDSYDDNPLIIYRCPNCMKTHIGYYNDVYNSNDHFNVDKCPDCGYEYKDNRDYRINSRNPELHRVMYRITKKGDFIYLEYLTNILFFNPINYKQIVDKIYDKIVINTKTGQSTKLPSRTTNKSGMKEYQINHIMNITYLQHSHQPYFNAEIIDSSSIINDIMELMDLPQYNRLKDLDIYDVFYINRFKGLINENCDSDFLYYLSVVHYNNSRQQYTFDYNTESRVDTISKKLSSIKPTDTLLDACKKYNIPNKKKNKKNDYKKSNITFYI